MSDDKIIDVTPKKLETFEEKAERLLSPYINNLMKKYLDSGEAELSPATVSAFYRLYMNGSSIGEIQRLNPSFHKAAIYIAQIKHNWDEEKEKAANELQEKVYGSVVKAQAEIIDLLTTMATVMHKKNTDKYKKYLQTGDVKNLKGSVDISGVGSLLKIIDGLQKITGADKAMKQKSGDTFNLNVSGDADKTGSTQLVTGNTDEGAIKDHFDSDDAARILEVLAQARRKKVSE